MIGAATYVWDGETMRPELRYADQISAALKEGQRVFLAVPSDRTPKSHRHEFAAIKEAWDNLPEKYTGEAWATTAETLRKHALIATGHCDCETIACGSTAVAQRVAGFASKASTDAAGYCIVSVEAQCVRVFTPHSQSKRAMGSAKFYKSKADILEWIANLLEVTAADLEQNAGASA